MNTLNDGMQNVLRPMGAAVEDRGIRFASGQGISWDPPPGVVASHPVVAAACAAVRVAAEHAAARQKLTSDERLSDLAMAQDAVVLDSKFTASLERAESELQERVASIEAEHARLLDPPRLEPTDAVSALQDREIRDHVRGLPIGDALDLIGENSEVANAVLRSPLPLLDSLVKQARERRIADLKGSAQFESRENGMAVAKWSRSVLSQTKRALAAACRPVSGRQQLQRPLRVA